MSGQPMSFEQARTALDAHVRHGAPLPADMPPGEPTSLTAALHDLAPHCIADCWSALLRCLRCLVLRLKIRETRNYLLECEEDGLRDSLSLRDFRQQLDDLQSELQALRGRS